MAGRPLEGFTLMECDEVFGDSIERTVTWKDGQADLRSLAGRPVRLRLVMKDADLFSFRFSEMLPTKPAVEGRERTLHGKQTRPDA